MKLKLGIAALAVLIALFVGAQEIIQVKTDSVELQDHALVVYKSPTCGCCDKWIDHLQAHNFTATVQNESNLTSIKQKFGIKPQHQSCHTAVHDSGYIFEGHIPAEIVSRFLEKPIEEAIGLAVPGMPLGSPGMEYQNRIDPYVVRLLLKDGSVSNYASVSAQGIQYHF